MFFGRENELCTQSNHVPPEVSFPRAKAPPAYTDRVVLGTRMASDKKQSVLLFELMIIVNCQVPLNLPLSSI